MEEQLEKTKSIANNEVDKYIPERGDVFEWCDEKYFCIESTSFSGVVNLFGETFYQRGFIWNYGGEKPIFIRKATEEELQSLGMDDLIKK